MTVKFTSPLAYTPKHLAEKILTARPRLGGERKPVTVLVADLGGASEALADIMTPDQNLVLERLPNHANVVFFTGESGQSFMFTPLIGPALSELALAGVTRYNIDAFSISRPGLLAQGGGPR